MQTSQTVNFPGNYDNLEKIGALVERAAQQAGLDDSACYAVQLAVDEACSNIIEHAYGGEGRGEIQCSTIIHPDNLTVVLRDFGAPFNPDSVPIPNLNQPIEEFEEQGLGLYWMRKLMDEVHFEFTADQGNVLTLVKRKKAEA